MNTSKNGRLQSGSAILIEMDEIGIDDMQQLSLWIKDSEKIFWTPISMF